MIKKTFIGVLFVALLSTLIMAGTDSNVTKAVNYSSSGTPVGGIIWENTTWTLENSPYTITDTVQIPSGVMLTIEPGVTVTRPTEGTMFREEGIIYANGTIDNKITFDGGGNSIFFWDGGLGGGSTQNTFLSLDYCIIKNGYSFYSGSGKGSLSLRHSHLINLTCFSGVMFHEREVYIEHNYFTNSGGFRIRTLSNIYIRYNLFNGIIYPAGFDEFCIFNEANYWGSEAIIKYNSFINMDGIVLRSGFDAIDINASENYWGTEDIDVIDSMIYDRNDDLACAGFIEYLPILTEPHPDTPTLPLTVNFTYSPAIVYAYGAVTFDATASFGPYSSIANYTWDFGDGNITHDIIPTVKHTYTIPDSYNVTLTVTDEFGFQNSTVTSIAVLEDDVPPMIGIPSRIPEGDVEPDHEVGVSVNVTDFESGVKNVTLSCLNMYKPVSNFTTVKDLNITLCLHRTTYYYKDPVSGDVTITYLNGTAFKGIFVIYVLAQFDGHGMTTYPGLEINGFTKFYISPPVFRYGSGNYTIGIAQLSTADGYIIESRWQVFPNVQVEAKDDSMIWIDLPMTFNSTTGLYEATIPGQGEDILVRYKITAYDNAGNYRVEDKDGEYYVYTVIPEFLSTMILLLFMIATLAVTVYKRKHSTDYRNSKQQKIYSQIIFAIGTVSLIKGEEK